MKFNLNFYTPKRINIITELKTESYYFGNETDLRNSGTRNRLHKVS